MYNNKTFFFVHIQYIHLLGGCASFFVGSVLNQKSVCNCPQSDMFLSKAESLTLPKEERSFSPRQFWKHFGLECAGVRVPPYSAIVFILFLTASSTTTTAQTCRGQFGVARTGIEEPTVFKLPSFQTFMRPVCFSPVCVFLLLLGEFTGRCERRGACLSAGC